MLLLKVNRRKCFNYLYLLIDYSTNPYLLVFYVLSLVSNTFSTVQNSFSLQIDLINNIKENSRNESCVNSFLRSELQGSGTQKYTCVSNHVQRRINENHGLKSMADWDTLTSDDIVRKQYAKLPYPAVTQRDIQLLRAHYNSDRQHIPFAIAPTQALETINHYLYRGRNNFL